MVSMTAELMPSPTALMYSGDLPESIEMLTSGMLILLCSSEHS
jgi:hypothetical protein